VQDSDKDPHNYKLESVLEWCNKLAGHEILVGAISEKAGVSHREMMNM
jgi:hypothetical protein